MAKLIERSKNHTDRSCPRKPIVRRSVNRLPNFFCHSFATELDVDHAAWIVESNRPRMLSSLFSKVIRLLGTHERESSATGHASPFAGGRGKKPKMVTLPWLAVFISTYSL